MGLGFVRFEECLDVGEAAGFGEAADRQLLDVASGGRRRGGVIGGGEGGVDFERLVGIEYLPEALLSSGDVYDFGGGGGGEVAGTAESKAERHCNLGFLSEVSQIEGFRIEEVIKGEN